MGQQQHKTSRSFSDKWPPDIEDKGYSQVPNCLLQCRASLGLNSSELAILLHLCTYDYGTKKVWPSHATLAKQSGLGHSTVRSNIVSLESKGFIRRLYRTGTSNQYDLVPIIAKLRSHDCRNPARKQAHPRLKSSRSPPQVAGTKEDQKRKYIKKNVVSIKEIIGARYD